VSAELYLIRHAEALGDDQADPGLSAHGRDQARSLASRLDGMRLAGILHSPRRRAAETAEVLAQARPDVAVLPSDQLDDRTPVPSPGRRETYPQRYHPWLDLVPTVERDVDGVRLSEALRQLGDSAVERAENGPLVLITHAFVIGWFVRTLLDAPEWRWLQLQPANAGLTVLRWEPVGAGALVSFNDTGHLSDGSASSTVAGALIPSTPGGLTGS
jgi:serine/threonine-protein phosphatase PGAM5